MIAHQHNIKSMGIQDFNDQQAELKFYSHCHLFPCQTVNQVRTLIVEIKTTE